MLLVLVSLPVGVPCCYYAREHFSWYYKLDTIFNHMSGQDNGGTGVAGSSFQHYVYPGIYQNQDFHHCGLEPGDDIVNYDNRVEVQTCELVNLAE